MYNLSADVFTQDLYTGYTNSTKTGETNFLSRTTTSLDASVSSTANGDPVAAPGADIPAGKLGIAVEEDCKLFASYLTFRIEQLATLLMRYCETIS